MESTRKSYIPDDLLARNNFDLLRLLFASVVGVVHFIELSGLVEFKVVTRILSSEVSVRAFFVISGFLIFHSFERSSSFGSYFSKRVRRIYPAYFVVVMTCAFGLFCISTLSVSDYFSIEWLKYVIANLLFLNFLHPTLPGVFDTNLYSAVNGALWTLKIEVMFYFAVPLIVMLLRKYNRFGVLVGVYLISFLYLRLMNFLWGVTGYEFYLELGRQLPGQLMWFISGALLLYYFEWFQRYRGMVFLFSLGMLFFGESILIQAFQPIALGIVVIFSAVYFWFGNFGKYGDFSYGVYIVHFPLIQILLSVGFSKYETWVFFSTFILFTIALSVLIWHVIEKRFLFRNNHYLVG